MELANYHASSETEAVSKRQEAQPETRARANEIGEHVHRALDVLSAAQRQVFVLRHYEGLQLAEIADAMGCSIGSVKVHLFRAVRKLRQELEDVDRF